MVMWFNVPEARAELLKEKHVFTLRPKRRKREGHEILMYNGFGKKGDLEVEYWGKFSEMGHTIIREIAKNSGFKTLEDWLKAAKGADFLYYVRLTNFQFVKGEGVGGKQQENNMKYPIVCLCGSTRFEKETMEMAEGLTLAGQIVLMVNCWTRKDALHEPQNLLDEKIKAMLDDLHKEKIKMADYVLVMNIGGYIGKSTQSEIDFAQRIGKPVKFLEQKEEAQKPK